MLSHDYTAKLLNLEDVIVTNVENISEELHIYIELPLDFRKNVKYFVCDMNPHFRQVAKVCFKKCCDCCGQISCHPASLLGYGAGQEE